MNKALKIGLITTAVALPCYLGVRLYLRNKQYKESENRFKENDTEKKLLIMQILITKGIDPSDSNISSYMNYTIEQLKNMINQNVENAPQANSLDGYSDYGSSSDYSSDYSYGYNYDY